MAAVRNGTAAERYEEAIAVHGAALARLARAYEVDPDRRLDLLQEIHIALWRSLAGFDERCSLRTWVYRLYLEGMDASAIADITGLSSGNVATKVHRIKKILSERFHQGGRHVE